MRTYRASVTLVFLAVMLAGYADDQEAAQWSTEKAIAAVKAAIPLAEKDPT